MAILGNKTKDVTKFFYELGMLKRVKRSGWWMAKIDDPESVAEHSFRTAVMAYVIAKMEGSDRAKEIALAALFHDVMETRILDVHKVHSAYVPTPPEAKKRIKAEQYSLLPKDAAYELIAISNSLNEKERAILKDADYLEVAFQGKEYLDIGYKDAKDWIDRVGEVLKTGSARKLWSEMKRTDSSVWWRGLKQSVKELKY